MCLKWDVPKKKKTNCDNTIAEIGEEKKIVAIVAMHYRNRGKKIVVTEVWGGIKKIRATSIIFLKHFHNKSHVISYY